MTKRQMIIYFGYWIHSAMRYRDMARDTEDSVDRHSLRAMMRQCALNAAFYLRQAD